MNDKDQIIQQFDTVLLKDGRRASVVEVYGDQEVFDVDVGASPKDWDTITVQRNDIVDVLEE